MADVPSVFNRADFFGVLLPGYLLIIDYLFLFRPALLFTSSNSTLTFSSGANSVSVNLLSTAIFLVAGPVAGMIIRQAHRGLLRLIISALRPGINLPGTDERYFKHLLSAKDTAIAQLDRKECQYDFDVSSFIVLVGLNLLHLWMFGADELFVIGGLFVAAGLLAIDSYFAYKGYTGLLKVFSGTKQGEIPPGMEAPTAPPPGIE